MPSVLQGWVSATIVLLLVRFMEHLRGGQAAPRLACSDQLRERCGSSCGPWWIFVDAVDDA